METINTIDTDAANTKLELLFSQAVGPLAVQGCEVLCEPLATQPNPRYPDQPRSPDRQTPRPWPIQPAPQPAPAPSR